MRLRAALLLLFCAALLLFQFYQFNVLQDDAFISFRYVRNFLEGQGLVFNIGQRVEGYTNFFWIILLAFFSKLGLPLVGTARVAGLLAAAGTLGAGLYAARRWYPERGWMWLVSVPFLLSANGSLAYWGGSGLETGLFALLSALAALSYFSRPAFSLLFVSLATLTRPEGALLAFLFGVGGLLLKQKSWKETWLFWGGLGLMLLPFGVFKYLYYGSLLPNPFYAKTGFSLEYLGSGLAYAWLFLKHYGGYGLFLLVPIVLWKRLLIFSRFSFLVFSGFTLYLILIGGDVLKAHRFFVPVLFFLYLPLADGLFQLIGDRWFRRFAFTAAVFVTAMFSYGNSHSYLKTSASGEKGLLSNMTFTAHYFVDEDWAKSFALSTIGAFSYYVGDRRVIDMLGLTEPVIAKNPEKIAGLVSTWKERHFNAGYVLSQKPDVILFATGVKPSAPADRALLLYPDFRQNYRLEFSYQNGQFNVYYRRFQNHPVGARPDQPARFANLFHDALSTLNDRDIARGLELAKQSLADGPRDFPSAYSILAYFYYLDGQLDSGEVYIKKGLEGDGGGSMSRFYYFNLLQAQNRPQEAAQQESVITRMVPSSAALFSLLKLKH